MGFMLQPIVRSLLTGIQQTSNFSTTFGGGPGAHLASTAASLGRGDLFVWVGLWRLVTDGERVLQALTRRGVHTVFYSTDAADMQAGALGWACALNNRLPVSEIWEYSHSTIEACRSHQLGAHRTRYVPPGFLPRRSPWGFSAADTPRLAAPASPLVMLAAMNYPPRARCFNGINASLAGRAPLLHFSDAWNDAALNSCMRQFVYYLNLHKECPSSRNCETVRFAQLLNAGAGRILSDRCHPKDEEAWDGIVTFRDRSDIADSFLALRAADLESAEAAERGRRARFQRFERRFSTVAILHRAGIPELLSQLALSAGHKPSTHAACSGSGATIGRQDAYDTPPRRLAGEGIAHVGSDPADVNVAYYGCRASSDEPRGIGRTSTVARRHTHTHRGTVSK